MTLRGNIKEKIATVVALIDSSALVFLP